MILQSDSYDASLVDRKISHASNSASIPWVQKGYSYCFGSKIFFSEFRTFFVFKQNYIG